jgi:hypothetical protein
LAPGRQSAGTHARLLKKGCMGCTKSLGAGAALSLMVLSEAVSSLPAACCASRVQPGGEFLVPSGKKFTVSAGHAACTSSTCWQPVCVWRRASWSASTAREGARVRG